MTLRNIKLNLPNRYILSISNEMLEVHDGLVEVALLNPDRDFVNTWLWLGLDDGSEIPDNYPDVERFLGARHLPRVIQKAYAYAERIKDAKI